MQVAFGQDPYVAGWVASQLGQTGFAGNYVLGAIGVYDNGQIIGGTVFHNYYPKEGVVEMTSASIDSRWLTRRMIRAIFTYAFDLLECQIVVLRISADNSVMLNIAKRFGFNSYTIPRLRGKTEDEVIATFTDDQWRSSKYRRP